MPGAETLKMLGLDAAYGERLSLSDYREDFRERQWTIDNQDSWKLERAQHFEEDSTAGRRSPERAGTRPCV
ncbi:MAG: hypothetical protein HOV66_13525 [Streptomycetaceae bacterium]|nr:hypothetical protein [Streptomycetaceae bacterium]